MSIEVGQPFPDTKFAYVAHQEDSDLVACGVPGPLDTAKEWAGKTVVLFGVPGAFTPTCQAQHIPKFVELVPEFKKKGVDVIAVVAANDPFVMSAWGKANGVKGDILMLSDPNVEWAQKTGYNLDLSKMGLGQRVTRFGLIIKDGKVIYAEKEANPGATPEVSNAETMLSKL